MFCTLLYPGWLKKNTSVNKYFFTVWPWVRLSEPHQCITKLIHSSNFKRHLHVRRCKLDVFFIWL